MQTRKYYEAYDERYKTVHARDIRWFGDEGSPIVLETISKFRITGDRKLLEIGCGEGRDAQVLLDRGFNLLATDVSPEAIAYCKKLLPAHQAHFRVLDCIRDRLPEKFDFIYAVAVIHMLVPDADRTAFYRFIHRHLTPDGIALICTMGDGKTERQTDPGTAFALQEKEYDGGTVLVAGTSCRMVSRETFEQELLQNGFEILEAGQTQIPSVFPEMMYAVAGLKRDAQ